MKLSTTGWLLLGWLAASAATGAAQTRSVSGEAYAAYVNTPFATQDKTPYSVLPAGTSSDGAIADATGDNLSVARALATETVSSIATGAISNKAATTQSIASAAAVSLLNGLITATHVLALSSSGSNGGNAYSNSDGSAFEDLVVNGVALGPDVAPNTRIALPGVGYVVLNEQSSSGDGVSSSGLTVNMIHVVLTNALTGAQTGEIIIASAQTAVSF